jgi:hypothetical protein
MFRKFMAWLLRADLGPRVTWSEAQSGQALARITVDVARIWSGRETLEQVLIVDGNDFVLLKRWPRNRHVARVRFAAPLQAAQMRLAEIEPGPPPQYRLHLWPVDGASVYDHAWPTWFGLWRNESQHDLGAGLCFIDGSDREQLKQLRHRLLGGQIPASLANEEQMWEQINGMSDADRRAAMAALVTQSFAAVDRAFQESHPDAGPVPESLQPAYDTIQQRMQQIQQTAAERPVDPVLEKLMQRFVLDATKHGPVVDRADENDA